VPAPTCSRRLFLFEAGTLCLHVGARSSEIFAYVTAPISVFALGSCSGSHRRLTSSAPALFSAVRRQGREAAAVIAAGVFANCSSHRRSRSAWFVMIDSGSMLIRSSLHHARACRRANDGKRVGGSRTSRLPRRIEIHSRAKVSHRPRTSLAELQPCPAVGSNHERLAHRTTAATWRAAAVSLNGE